MVQRGEAQVASIEVVPCKSNQRSTGEPNSSSGLSQYCPSPWVGVAFGPLDGRGRSNLGHARNKRQHLLDGPRTVSASPRRVWRMTCEAPQGEFVAPALKPAETTARKTAAIRHRSLAVLCPRWGRGLPVTRCKRRTACKSVLDPQIPDSCDRSSPTLGET